MKRLAIRVKWNKAVGLWVVARADAALVEGTLFQTTTKRKAITFARIRARWLWEQWKEPARVVVYRKNGSVQVEWTYGREPRKRTG